MKELVVVVWWWWVKIPFPGGRTCREIPRFHTNYIKYVWLLCLAGASMRASYCFNGMFAYFASRALVYWQYYFFLSVRICLFDWISRAFQFEYFKLHFSWFLTTQMFHSFCFEFQKGFIAVSLLWVLFCYCCSVGRSFGWFIHRIRIRGFWLSLYALFGM